MTARFICLARSSGASATSWPPTVADIFLPSTPRHEKRTAVPTSLSLFAILGQKQARLAAPPPIRDRGNDRRGRSRTSQEDREVHLGGRPRGFLSRWPSGGILP